MKLFPDSSSTKCGLLNTLVKKSNKADLYLIPENTIAGNIQTLIDCTVNSNWASGHGSPYFTIFLNQSLIKISNVSLTRRNSDCYPNNASIEGNNKGDWIQICNLGISFSSSSETRVYSCASRTYYSSIRLKQYTSSGGYDYLEIHSFDVFGEMINSSEKRQICTKGCTNKFKHNITLVFLLIIYS